uniref:Uncharacterized protein n=1 Tax=Arundo donax TaxID=35708 RepID=A0A0A9B808_ARUDO
MHPTNVEDTSSSCPRPNSASSSTRSQTHTFGRTRQMTGSA